MNNKLGVSLYLSNLENIEYLHDAKKAGVRNLFMSIHTPEDIESPEYISNVKKMFEIANTLKFEDVICDISPISLSALEIKVDEINELKKYGITSLRLDYGFADQEQAFISSKFKVSINASQVTEEQLINFKNNGSINNLIGFHNFYPLPGTALSINQMIEKDVLLRKYGINKIYSFIPGKNNFRKTGNISLGLVTLEKQRSQSCEESFIELVDCFKHDVVYIADPDFYEIENKKNEPIKAVIDSGFIDFQKAYKIRESSDYIRLRGTRSNFPSESGKPNNKFTEIKPILSEKIVMGDILICNSNASRYLGEIFIAKKDIEKRYLHLFNKIGHCQLGNDQISLIEKAGEIIFTS